MYGSKFRVQKRKSGMWKELAIFTLPISKIQSWKMSSLINNTFTIMWTSFKSLLDSQVDPQWPSQTFRMLHTFFSYKIFNCKMKTVFVLSYDWLVWSALYHFNIITFLLFLLSNGSLQMFRRSLLCIKVTKKTKLKSVSRITPINRYPSITKG